MFLDDSYSISGPAGVWGPFLSRIYRGFIADYRGLIAD